MDRRWCSPLRLRLPAACAAVWRPRRRDSALCSRSSASAPAFAPRSSARPCRQFSACTCSPRREARRRRCPTSSDWCPRCHKPQLCDAFNTRSSSGKMACMLKCERGAGVTQSLCERGHTDERKTRQGRERLSEEERRALTKAARTEAGANTEDAVIGAPPRCTVWQSQIKPVMWLSQAT